MSGYGIEIPQEKENSTIWSRQLRVAAYCRVSTPYEEQQKSLEKQIEYFTQYIKRDLIVSPSVLNVVLDKLRADINALSSRGEKLEGK